MTPDMLSEALIQWLAVFSIVVYLTFIFSRGRVSGLEQRLALLLIVVAFLFSARSVWWLSEHWLAIKLANLAVSCLPLMLIIFTEGILRQHAPLFIKCTSFVMSLYLVFISLYTNFSTINTYVLLAYELFVLFSIAVLVLTRDKDTFSHAENRLIQTLGLTAILSAPLFISDFGSILDLPMPRLGALSVFLFLYIFIRQNSDINAIGQFIKELVIILFRGVLVGGLFLWLSGDYSLVHFQAFLSVAIALSFLLSMLGKLDSLRREKRVKNFNHWLASASVDNADSFIRSLEQYAPLQDAVIVTGVSLQQYDSNKLEYLLKQEGTLLNMQKLQMLVATSADEDICFAAEQVLDLLARNNCNQLCLISYTPLTMLLINLPETIGSWGLYAELGIVDKLARALASR